MGHVKGLTNLSVEKNPKYMEPWLIAIGRYMLNFGSVEMISYKYLNTLEKTEEEFLKNTEKSFFQRIKRIENLISETNLVEKEEILFHWDKAKEISKWRNRIAHNPVLPVWKPGSDSENSPPDLIGISDMKQINKESKVTDSISLEGLNKLNDVTVKMAERLYELSEVLKNA